jgi:uncharacterized protein (DUF885 family)
VRQAAWIAVGVIMSLSASGALAESPAVGVLNKLFADERASVWKDDPLQATSDDVHTYDDRLPRVTPADQKRRIEDDKQFLARLDAIDRTALTVPQRVSYDLFAFMVEQRVTLARYREWRTPLNSDSGFHVDVLLMHETANPHTAADYEHYIARLKDVPRYFHENIANMREGVAEGFTLPAEILDGVSKVIAGEQFKKPEDCPLWQPFANFAATVPEGDRQKLAAAGRAAIANSVIPAYAEFRHFFETEYRPHARRRLGASQLPDGQAYYADLVRYFTSLPDATPQAIHALGLSEVARVHKEMEAVIREAKFKGSFSDFLTFLRTDPQFYAKTPDELLKDAAWTAKEIDERLPKFFGKLPRMTYGVDPVPAALAPNYTAGRYNPGPIGSAGQYWVNTYALNMRPLWALPALTLHEAVPGHHLQGALAREMTDVPTFRLNFYPNAFGEGWGLYSEKLGVEMGIYHTPYENFGRLTYEMWRACRLVVDTGIHSMGWSRQQAVDFLTQNTSLSKQEIRTEVDRYIAWPGQALAYKMGELKILELRHRAEKELGPRFDLRAFHDAVLANGGVTLPVLEERINAFIAESRSKAH